MLATGAPAAGPATSPSVTQAIRAVTTAERRVPRGRAYEVEAEHFRGKRVWEVKVALSQQRPYTFYVSANGQTILRTSRARRFDGDARRALGARVTIARALRIADARATGRLSEAGIDRHRGTLVWEVSFERPEVEVIVNAGTAQVIRVKHDD